MISFFKKNRKTEVSKKKGFTLVELMVVAGIFAIITSIIIFNYGNFSDNILATNMAYEVGLVTRQAQVFGLGVRGTGGEFTNAYGIFANLSDGSSSNGTKNLIFFVDNKPDGGNGQCNDQTGSNVCTCSSAGGVNDECLERLTLQRGILIDELQLKNNAGVCSLTNQLSVTFKRPNPDAIIVDQENDTAGFELAQIRIDAPRSSNYKYVVIRNTGQISVEDNPECQYVENSQQPDVSGCTDPSANNYNPNATTDDGSCTYTNNGVSGCTDPNALNYNSSATIDDGTCAYENQDSNVYGCTDPTASNYNPNANVDNATCSYTSDISGCTNPTALNYDPAATTDDGSCAYPTYGCTDPSADNYDPDANEDDSSCTYSSSGSDGGSVICTELYRQGYITDEIYKADELFGRTIDHKIMIGYRLIANPIVNMMKKSETITNIVYVVAEPWINEMAFQMGVKEKGSIAGKIILSVGKNISLVAYYLSEEFLNNSVFVKL